MSRRATGSWRSETGNQQARTPITLTTAPAVKIEDVSLSVASDDTEMQDVISTNGTAVVGEKTGFWARKKAAEGGRIVKKKKDPNTINKRLKKYVKPKNALVCLNELVPNVKYVTEVEGGGGKPTCVLVEVAGQEFRGYGSSKSLAKQAAAEAALVSFVQAPKAGEEAAAGDGDSTPWVVLASFAMYKLFNDWREGRVGMCAVPSYGGMPAEAIAAAAQAFPAPPFLKLSKVAAAKLEATQRAAAQAAATEVLVVSQKKTEQNRVPLPAKILPTTAATMHPVMLLHQMRPSIVFETIMENSVQNVSAVIDGIVFKGEAGTVKKAKFNLATDANEKLFGVKWEGASS